MDTYIHYLAVGIANLINIFFPEVIGLSGGVANQGENLLKPCLLYTSVFSCAYTDRK